MHFGIMNHSTVGIFYIPIKVFRLDGIKWSGDDANLLFIVMSNPRFGTSSARNSKTKLSIQGMKKNLDDKKNLKMQTTFSYLN